MVPPLPAHPPARKDPRHWRASEQHHVGFGRLLQDPKIPQRNIMIKGQEVPLKKPTAWKTDDYFALVTDCPDLNALGHTRVKSVLHGYKEQWYTRHEFDAGFCVAPQWYKSDELYSRFPLKPHQHGITFCGNDYFPIPQSARRFNAGEDLSAQEMQRSAFVRKFHLPTEEIRAQITSRYWPRAKKHRDTEDDTTQKWYQRMASSFLGGKLTSSKSVWLPKGEMWNNETRIQGPAEALQIWDEVVNSGMHRSSSQGGVCFG